MNTQVNEKVVLCFSYRDSVEIRWKLDRSFNLILLKLKQDGVEILWKGYHGSSELRIEVLLQVDLRSVVRVSEFHWDWIETLLLFN